MLVSVQLCRPAGRAGLAPAPAFTRSRWVSNPSPAAGPSRPFTFTGSGGRERRARQTMGRKSPPPPASAAASFLIGTGKCLFQQKAGSGLSAAPLPRGEGGGRCEAAGPRFLPPGREGLGQGRAGAGALGQHRHLSSCSGSVRERICWSKRFMVRAQVACFAYVVVGRENAPLRHC